MTPTASNDQSFAYMQTVSQGGMTSLFRGMGAPFATVAVYNAVLFAARGQMESILAHADGAVFAQAVCYQVMFMLHLVVPRL